MLIDRSFSQAWPGAPFDNKEWIKKYGDGGTYPKL
jgi:hypothetical protein